MEKGGTVAREMMIVPFQAAAAAGPSRLARRDWFDELI